MGQVALKLKYPVTVEEITIDHVSLDIVPEEWHNSAPKKIKVIGYPPCDSGDKDCLSLGFDDKDPVDIADFTYDLEGPSVQTFDSHYGRAIKELALKATQKEEAESGSCSVEAASCSAPPRIPVAGLVIKVFENWGNEDFTCLYRVRIHGEAQD
jgi:hypothetical protein